MDQWIKGPMDQGSNGPMDEWKIVCRTFIWNTWHWNVFWPNQSWFAVLGCLSLIATPLSSAANPWQLFQANLFIWGMLLFIFCKSCVFTRFKSSEINEISFKESFLLSCPGLMSKLRLWSHYRGGEPEVSSGISHLSEDSWNLSSAYFIHKVENKRAVCSRETL